MTEPCTYLLTGGFQGSPAVNGFGQAPSPGALSSGLAEQYPLKLAFTGSRGGQIGYRIPFAPFGSAILSDHRTSPVEAGAGTTNKH